MDLSWLTPQTYFNFCQQAYQEDRDMRQRYAQRRAGCAICDVLVHQQRNYTPERESDGRRVAHDVYVLAVAGTVTVT